MFLVYPTLNFLTRERNKHHLLLHNMPWNNEFGDDTEGGKKTESSDVDSLPETTVQIIQKVLKKLLSLLFFVHCINLQLPSSYTKEN